MSGRVGPLKPSFINTYSLDFDGMDDYVDVGEIPPLFKKFPIGTAKDNPWSASMWVKGSTSGAFLQLPYGEINSLSARAFAFALGASGLYFGGKFANIKIRESGTTAYNSSGWNHVLMTFDGVDYTALSSYKLYVNGTLIPIELIPVNITDFRVKSILIGGTQLPWLGKIDEVSLFDAELTTSNVTSIYNGGKPTDLTPLNPIAWYRMGDNGAYKDPQWLIPNNENKDKVSNYSMELDGLDDYIEILPNGLGSIYAVQEYSIEFWFKTNFGEPYEVLWSYDYTDHSPPYYAQHIRINTPSNAGGNGNIRLLTNNNGIYTPNPHLITPNTIALYDNTWHHIVATRTLTTKDIYLDGINVASGSYGSETTNYYAQEVWQGRANFSNGYTKGNFGFVKFYNSRLTSTNISDLYNGGTPIDIPGITPISHWKMGEDATFNGSNWTLPDSVGTNDGTSANMTIEDRVGTAPSSSNNALSFNMDLIDRVEDTPPS